MRGINEDEQCELVGLCWPGCGGFSADEWNTTVEEARSLNRDYVIGIPLVSDYLEEGLSQFDRCCEGFEMGVFERELGGIK